jgi:transcriptional regulator with XRE-family HTH domain
MDVIRYFREKAGMTQGELAKKVGLSLMTISRYETGKRNPCVNDLKRIARALGRPPKDMLLTLVPVEETDDLLYPPPEQTH